jgi:hypothetical protein
MLLISTTDAPTKWLPVKFNVNVDWTSASVAIVGLIEVRTGVGLELPQSGLIAEQPGRPSAATIRATSDHRTERDGISELLGVRIEHFRLIRFLASAETDTERIK